MSRWGYPLTRCQAVELEPPIGGLVMWKPWCSDDGAHVGWVACFDDGMRWFDYIGLDPDDQTQLVRYQGKYGIPGADDVVT